MKRTGHSIRLGGYVGLILLMGCDTIMTSTLRLAMISSRPLMVWGTM